MVLIEHDRFAWFASQLEPRRHHYSVDQLCKYLYAPATWPAQRERVLVLLSMHEDEQAYDVLHHYIPDPADAALALFRGMALQAWQERHGKGEIPAPLQMRSSI
jgi:hypothetical protein